MDLSQKLASIRRRMEEAARRGGRDPESVHLVAVAKTRSAAEVREAIRAGVTDVGENRVQEAEEKRGALAGENVTWHLVGHLQSNKAAKAVSIFDVIHSVDSVELAARISRIAGEAGKMQRILVQVDLAGEATKSGLPAEELLGALEEMQKLQSVRVEGLMVLPPFFEDASRARPYFVRLRELARDASARGVLDAPGLSMGMSHDFEVAIEEGATWVRIGTALFGERKNAV